MDVRHSLPRDSPYHRGDNSDGGNDIVEAVGELDDDVGIHSFRGDDGAPVDEACRGDVLALLLLLSHGRGCGDAGDGGGD